MTNRVAKSLPQTYARIGGALYLFNIIIGLFAEAFVRGKLIVPLDPAATAIHIVGSESLFRVGLAGEMLTSVFDIALALILYVLLKPVDKYLALLAAFFRLIYVGTYSVAKLFEIMALTFLGKADYLHAFQPQQLHVLTYTSLRLHGLSYGASLLFFGFCCILFGYLIYKSGYLPRIIGAVLAIAGLCYAVYSLSQMLSPGFTTRLFFPWLLLPGFFAEVALALWLTIRGVNLTKWEAKASG